MFVWLRAPEDSIGPVLRAMLERIGEFVFSCDEESVAEALLKRNQRASTPPLVMRRLFVSNCSILRVQSVSPSKRNSSTRPNWLRKPAISERKLPRTALFEAAGASEEVIWSRSNVPQRLVASAERIMTVARVSARSAPSA